MFYANIYAYNNSHEALREQILSYDADVVLLVEFSDHQYRQMNDFWEEHYPYVNHVRENNLYGFNLIASKYPFAREYYEMEDEWVALESFLIEQEVNDDLMVHLVHSASPASASVFEQRNRQLETITDVME